MNPPYTPDFHAPYRRAVASFLVEPSFEAFRASWLLGVAMQSDMMPTRNDRRALAFDA
jgi:hypothetical protein